MTWQAADTPTEVDTVYEQTLNSWQQSVAAIGFRDLEKENPTVEPGVKPHDIMPKERLFTSLQDDGMPPDGEDVEFFNYSTETDNAKAFENEEYLNVKLSGSEHLKETVGSLVKEFRDLFFRYAARFHSCRAALALHQPQSVLRSSLR